MVLLESPRNLADSRNLIPRHRLFVKVESRARRGLRIKSVSKTAKRTARAEVSRDTYGRKQPDSSRHNDSGNERPHRHGQQFARRGIKTCGSSARKRSQDYF